MPSSRQVDADEKKIINRDVTVFSLLRCSFIDKKNYLAALHSHAHIDLTADGGIVSSRFDM